MKVLLVRPVTSSDVVLNVVPPIGLGYLATALRKNNIKVELVDCVLKGMDHAALTDYAVQSKPDIVGFSMFSHDLPSVSKSTRLIKEVLPNVTILLGGPHPSAMPQETLNIIKHAGFLFKGEAENGLPKLVRYLGHDASVKLSDIPGLYWREGENILCNSQDFCEDLDSFSFPSWDLHDPRIYPPAPQGMIFKNLPLAPVMITRGCPFDCTFCAAHTIMGKKIRFRSLDNAIKEVEYLYNNYGVREIHILDDNFTLSKQYAKDFCNRLIDTKLKITWCCPNGIRIDSLDEELVYLMKKSGCYYISIGIESGSPRILEDMKKGLTREKIKRQIRLVKKQGLAVNGFFILGYPGETIRDINMTIDFAKNLDLTRAAFFNFIPLPGTCIYGRLLQKGELEKLSWDKMFEAYISYSPKGISKTTLKSLQRKAHLEFYLRPKIFFRLMLSLRSYNQFKFVIKRAFIYLFKMHK